MTYTYQKNSRYFAQVANDIKGLAEDELSNLGAKEIKPAYRGIYFSASPKTLYAINYHSRLLNRVLAPLITFNCHSDQQLYQKASQIDWHDFITSSQTFAVFANVSHSNIKHSKFAALRVKDAVVDQFQKKQGTRPSVDTKNPDLWISLFIDRSNATISIDTSGGSLHRRGYRKDSIKAPMIETLAAAIITLSEWDGKTPLVDPLCGSGTLLCEAFLYASKTPPALLRKKFGFEKLPDFNPTVWKQIKEDAKDDILPLPRGLISGSDISIETIKVAKKNCLLIDQDGIIEIKQSDLFERIKMEDKIIVCNPPYGIRMNSSEDLKNFYKRLGDFLKQRCKGSIAFIYFGDRAYIKNVGLKPSWKRPLSNSGLDGRLVKYELY